MIGLQPVTAPVTDGRMRLMAEMTPEGAQDLALVLRAGALPAQLTVAEERTSGVGRGQDAIRAMVIAGGVSTIVIVAFMIAFYGSFGTIASIAVVVNVIMMIAVLSLSGLLPDIARHCRHRVDDRNGGRQQRAGLRARARGGPGRPHGL